MQKARDVLASINDGKTPADTTHDAVLRECMECFEKLGWKHVSRNYANWAKVSVKNEYDAF